VAAAVDSRSCSATGLTSVCSADFVAAGGRSHSPRCDAARRPRHWRSYGDHPLPIGEQALDEPLRAFPSWFLRIVCERCGKDRMIS
jgi:hypothetical protein